MAQQRTVKQPNWLLIGSIAFVVAFLFFQPFLGAICFAALMAYMLYPIYKRIVRHTPPIVASSTVLILSFLIVFLPIAFLVSLAITQAISFAHFLQESSVSAASVAELSGPVVTQVNEFMEPLGYNEFINSESLAGFAQETIPHIINQMVDGVTNLATSLPQFLTSIIIYSFLFSAFLRYSASTMNFLKQLSPFDEEMSEKYIKKSGLIVTASLRGQFIISFVTAVSSALLLFLLGLQEYFMFFVIIFTILGMIPLGSGILMIPIALVAMVLGDFWPGFWVLTIYLLVICNIDTLLRPHLVPKKANIIPALTTLATFCGIYYFGILGVVYGPLIIILLTTTAEIYLSTRKQVA